MIYELLIRGAIDGTIAGAHLIRFNPDGTIGDAEPLPMKDDRPDIDAILPEIILAQQKTISVKDAEIELLKNKQQAETENWTPLTDALIQGDFLVWLTECLQVNLDSAIAMASLRTAVQSADVAGTKESFAKLAHIHAPTIARLQKWQAVLDQHKIRSIKFFSPNR